MRREGIYSSHLARWRRQRAEGELAALTPKRKAAPTPEAQRQTAELARLRRENQRLQANAYHERWEAEIMIDELDTHQRTAYRPFRSQKPVGVIQEFYGSLLAHYAIRAIMHDAALGADIDPDRLSFVTAVAEIQAAVREFQQTDPMDHARLYERMVGECRRTLLPPRRLRIYPRMVRQRRTKIPRKGPDDRGWCLPKGRFATAICLVGLDGQA